MQQPAAELSPDRPHRPLTQFYSAPRERPAYLADLFDRSAAHYNWISSVLAFGTDRYYRRTALRRAGLRPGMRMLDVATGTGLVAGAALDLGMGRDAIVGVDPSSGMLEENLKNTGISLCRGFGEKLPFRGRSFDFISMGYALRHVESLSTLFTEFRRVLNPGGSLLILEISRPQSRLVRALLRGYMQSMVPFLARFRSAGPEIRTLLRYYWASIDECVSPETIIAELQKAGFPLVERRRFGPMLNDFFARC